MANKQRKRIEALEQQANRGGYEEATILLAWDEEPARYLLDGREVSRARFERVVGVGAGYQMTWGDDEQETE